MSIEKRLDKCDVCSILEQLIGIFSTFLREHLIDELGDDVHDKFCTTILAMCGIFASACVCVKNGGR